MNFSPNNRTLKKDYRINNEPLKVKLSSVPVSTSMILKPTNKNKLRSSINVNKQSDRSIDSLRSVQ